VSDAQARVQLAALTSLASGGRERGELWRVTADPTTLPMGACYGDGEHPQSPSRAFYPDTAPGYFGDGWEGPRPRAASACGWHNAARAPPRDLPVDLQHTARRRRSRCAVGLINDATGARGAARRRQPDGPRDQPAAGRPPGRRHLSSTSPRTPLRSSRACRCSSPVVPRRAACTAVTASCTSTRAACTSPAWTARAAGSPHLPTITSCAGSRASSRFAGRRSAT
jgi:hypothetical protein